MAQNLSEKRYEHVLNKWGVTEQEVLPYLVQQLMPIGTAMAAQQYVQSELIRYGGPEAAWKPDVAEQAAATWSMTQRFGEAKDAGFVRSMPFGAAYVGFKDPSAQLNAAVSDGFAYLATLYGDEYMASYLQTALLDNPDQANNTIKILNDLANRQTFSERGEGATYPFRGGTYDANQRVGGLYDESSKLTPDEMLRVLNDPNEFNKLSIQEQDALIEQSRSMLETMNEFADPENVQAFSDAFSRGVGVIYTGDYSLALSRDEINTLRGISDMDLSGRSSVLTATVKTPELMNVGISQLRGGEGFLEASSTGGNTNVYVIDKEWAQSHPAKVMAVMAYMRENFPNMSVQVGEKGGWGGFLDTLGAPVDAVGGFFAATADQISEYTDNLFRSDADRQKLLDEAERLRASVAEGNVPENRVEETLRLALSLEDMGTTDVGWDSFQQDIMESYDVRNVGMGWATRLLQQNDYLPGDPGYAAVHATLGIVGAFAFDPINLLPGVLQGLKYARTIPRTAEEIQQVSRGFIAQKVYEMFAKTPEQMLVTRYGQKAIDRIWGAREALGADEFITRVVNVMGVDQEAARMLLQASSKEDLYLGVLETMYGAGHTLERQSQILGRMGEIATKLDAKPAIVKLQERIEDLKALPNSDDYADEIAALESDLDELTQTGVYTVEGQVGVDMNKVRLTVPAEELKPYLEFPARAELDEATGAMRGRTPEQVEELRQSLRANGYDETLVPEGWQEPIGPIRMEYNPTTGEAIIREAHHRIGAGALEGQNFPVEVTFVDEPLRAVSGANIEEVEASDALRALSELGSEGAQEVSVALSESLRTQIDNARLAAISAGRKATVGTYDFDQLAQIEARIQKERDVLIANGVEPEADEILALDEDLRRVQGEMGDIASQRAELIAEYAYLKSVAYGRDHISPLLSIPRSKDLIKIMPKGVFGETYLWALKNVERFPRNIMNSLGIKKFANEVLFAGKKGREIERTSEQFLIKMGNFVRHTGTGENLVFESTSFVDKLRHTLGNEILIDEVARSREHLRDFFGFLGHTDDKVNELLMGWETIGKSRANAFDWFISRYEQAILESPILTSTGKENLLQLWDSMLNERSPGFINKVDGSIVTPDPTAYKLVLDPASGKYIKAGRPVFSGDMLQSVRLPTYDQMREYMSWNKRILDNWKTYGKLRKPVAYGLQGLGYAWRGFANFWKNLVLIGKMPFALPGRILTEEMVRMAAFGYASAVHHPIEWLKSVRALDEFALFAESPTIHLGVLTNDLEKSNFFLARQGRQIVTSQDGIAFFRAESGVLAKRYASNETKRLLTMEADEFWAWAQTDEGIAALGDGWLENIREIVQPDIPGGLKSEVEVIERMKEELTTLVGSGDEAKNIEKALTHGRLSYKGKTAEIGTDEFAKMLSDMNKDGVWKPAAAGLPRNHGDYLRLGQQGLRDQLHNFRNNLFGTLYAKPDLYLARSPLYRQVAVREYKHLISLGYAENTAREIAKARGAREVADIMFTIGASTSAEYFMRNLMPFFPAWRELARTWLIKVPEHFGGGHALIGAPLLAHRADLYGKFFTQLGIVKKDNNGNYVIPVPGMGKFFNIFLPGEPLAPDGSLSVSSLTGLLPVPNMGDDNPIAGLFPQLGAPAAALLGVLRDQFGGAFDDAADYLAMFGTDTSFGPAAWDRMLEAFGWTPPWMNNATRAYHEAQRNWAVIDGVRMYIADGNLPPEPPENLAQLSEEEQKAFQERWEMWYEEALKAGEHTATWTYLTRGVLGTFMPVSVSFKDPEAEKLRAIQGIIRDANMPELYSSVLETYKDAYPHAWAYLASKNIRTEAALGVDEFSFETFREELKTGIQRSLTPEEWTVFSYGMNSWFQMVNERSAIYRELGETPSEVLLAGFERRRELGRIDAEWNSFLSLQAAVAEDTDGPNFEALFEEWQKGRQANMDEATLSIEQDRVLQAKDLLGEIAASMGPNRVPQEMRRVIGQLTDLAGNVDYPKPTTEIGKAMNWWWNNVGTPYQEEVDAIWEEINATPGALRAPLYEKLREVEAKYSQKYDSPFGTLPGPQQVFFHNLSPQARKQRLAEKATMPVSFLDEFYRQRVYGKEQDTEALNTLATFVNQSDQQLRMIVAQNGISTGSYAYEQLKAAVERAKAEKAQELGVAEVYRNVWLAPSFQRVDMALGLSVRNGSWAYLASETQRLWNRLEANDLSPRGSSEAAQVAQRYIIDLAMELRKKDPILADIFASLESALGEDGRPLVGPDMLMKVFFDYFGDSAPLYVYT